MLRSRAVLTPNPLGLGLVLGAILGSGWALSLPVAAKAGVVIAATPNVLDVGSYPFTTIAAVEADYDLTAQRYPNAFSNAEFDDYTGNAIPSTCGGVNSIADVRLTRASKQSQKITLDLTRRSLYWEQFASTLTFDPSTRAEDTIRYSIPCSALVDVRFSLELWGQSGTKDDHQWRKENSAKAAKLPAWSPRGQFATYTQERLAGGASPSRDWRRSPNVPPAQAATADLKLPPGVKSSDVRRGRHYVTLVVRAAYRPGMRPASDPGTRYVRKIYILGPIPAGEGTKRFDVTRLGGAQGVTDTMDRTNE